MNLKDKRLIAVFVVPVVIIAAVAGYYLYPVEEPLMIDEGFDEMTVEYQQSWGWIYQLNSTATTNVNDNSRLEFDVVVDSVVSPSSGDVHDIRIELDATGYFEDDLSPKTLEFRASGFDGVNVSLNDFIFLPKRGTFEGCNLWDGGYNSYGRGTGTAVVGFNVEQNNFSARRAELEWRIPPSNFGNPYTLEIQAIVGGLSEEVVATIHVHIDLFSMIESLEASTDSGHYYTSDYTSEADEAEGIFYVQPELNYQFENMPGGEEMLYDVEVYISSFDTDLRYRQIHNESNLKAGEDHTTVLTIHVDEGRSDMQVSVRFVIISQESNWSYDTLEDDEFELIFTVTNDGGG